MQFFIGTSGYSYPAWRGRFYPEKFPTRDMLSYYARRFNTVEINNSFYRMPIADDVQSWAGQVPGAFRFAIKAPQTITHRKRLKDAAKDTKELLRVAAVLKARRGPLLFQLPPNFKRDVPRLAAFLKLLGKQAQAAFEFRHESWFDDDVFACLRQNSCALCVADADDLPKTSLVRTADWGYLRLRRERYTKHALVRWIEHIRSQRWKEVYVYFKHEDTGTGPKLAARFLDLAQS